MAYLDQAALEFIEANAQRVAEGMGELHERKDEASLFDLLSSARYWSDVLHVEIALRAAEIILTAKVGK